MIKQTYLSNLKNLPVGSMAIRVCRPSLLSPSKELLASWKTNKLTWGEYERQYRLELLSREGVTARLNKIKELGAKQEVYLYCYEKASEHCHRTILLKLLKDMQAPVEGEGNETERQRLI